MLLFKNSYQAQKKGTQKLFRGKRRGKRLVFFYTLSDRTLKVITDFAGEIILQHLT